MIVASVCVGSTPGRALRDRAAQVAATSQDCRLRRDLVDGPNEVDLHALDRVGLKERVRSLPAGLDTAITAGGSNLSAGERQLLCLARATLRRATILLVDEATSSAEPDADLLLLTTLRSVFPDATALVIAHRLKHLAQFDAVLVIDNGSVVTYGPPTAVGVATAAELAMPQPAAP